MLVPRLLYRQVGKTTWHPGHGLKGDGEYARLPRNQATSLVLQGIQGLVESGKIWGPVTVTELTMV